MSVFGRPFSDFIIEINLAEFIRQLQPQVPIFIIGNIVVDTVVSNIKYLVGRNRIFVQWIARVVFLNVDIAQLQQV